MTHLRIHGIYVFVCVYVCIYVDSFQTVWGTAVGELKYCTCDCLFKLMTMEAV